jgi:hypothetical protein
MDRHDHLYSLSPTSRGAVPTRNGGCQRRVCQVLIDLGLRETVLPTCSYGLMERPFQTSVARSSLRGWWRHSYQLFERCASVRSGARSESCLTTLFLWQLATLFRP